MRSPLPDDQNRTATAKGYDLVSRVNHWVIATAFLVALAIGLVIDYAGLPDEQVFALYNWHMLFGSFVLLYGLWRVGWRIARGFCAPVVPAPGWQAIAAKMVHVALLAVIVLMPISGVLMTISGGFDLALWDVVLVPSIGEVEWLNSAAGAAHWFLSLVILGLLALHIGAVVKHHFIDRDSTLVRMTTGW